MWLTGTPSPKHGLTTTSAAYRDVSTKFSMHDPLLVVACVHDMHVFSPGPPPGSLHLGPWSKPAECTFERWLPIYPAESTAQSGMIICTCLLLALILSQTLHTTREL